ncbi:transcription-repair coupling factor [Desulfogranum mediterraneum]|uniref:transcription-repair coupling factor n=1 Tax=Desulfogranum mediterraneum TaxID=160661 RepID=UPI0004262C90|nr:transcription-repair coupling factor [Desulfogranum mediterraneum]
MQSTIQRLGADGSVPLEISGMNGASAALFLSRVLAERRRTLCCVLPAEEQLESFARDLALFSPAPVLVYPSFEIPPYTPLSPDAVTVGTRLSTLYRLQEETEPLIVLTSAEALLRRILPRSVFADRCELIMAGEEIDREGLIQNLTAGGYQSCELVCRQGDMAIRGGIVDLFPPASDRQLSGPLRLDFFGDTLESIRLFNPLSQRSESELEEAILLPASDVLFPVSAGRPVWQQALAEAEERYRWPREECRLLRERLAQEYRFPGIEFLLPLLYGGTAPLPTLTDYLPEGAGVILYDPPAIRRQMDLVHERIAANHQEALANQVVAFPPEELFVSTEQVMGACAGRTLAHIVHLPDPESDQPPTELRTGDHSLLRQEIELQRKKRGLLAPLADRIIAWQQQGELTLLACSSSRRAKHLGEMLGNYQLRSRLVAPPLDLGGPRDADEVLLLDQPLSQGFDLVEEKIHLVSATELFGDQRLQKKRRRDQRFSEGEPLPLDQLNSGDVVVHREHGVGIFQELVNMEISGTRGDFMLLVYRNEDKLYVPVDKLHWVSRYQGLTDQQPKLDSLGSQRWLATKKKVTDAVWKVAQELLEIYGQRAMRKGHQFSPPGELYRELEESFPFDETPGQAKAIDETLADLTSGQPMDRLVCGDVGYGKTEVAARAAFKVIEDGFQVAVLVPTTVLAEQHAATFRDRFTSFPVEVACLNRFRTSKQQKEISAGLAEGSIDLVVGTHRLLSKDINFSRLGLLIIDEEHRFGVSHKEKIKKFKASVDVLTLTATPIPRTLQMSLLGIRDLSVISTPPQQRRSVKTFLAKHDQLVIREAAQRELLRGGQLFFVHNRVRTIYRVAENIASLVPHARIGIAHGQMTGPQLEEVMVQFINHELDILVCTTIIESGLDIPNANTILINRADHLGLADIYQLRGRVGRSSRQAFAYLFVPSLEQLSKDAKKRLRALMDHSELGGGFKLAMNDLQIRGGGNLLGVSQSGHIAAVGYDLYLELLQATVADLKKQAATPEGEQPPMEVDPEVKLQLAAFLPDRYVMETSQRYQLYRRISALGSGTDAALEELSEELEDRYGPLPVEASNLLRIIQLKQRLGPLGINKLEQGPGTFILSFVEQTPVEPQRLLELVNQSVKAAKKNRSAVVVRLTPDNRLIVPLNSEQNLFQQIAALLDRL